MVVRVIEITSAEDRETVFDIRRVVFCDEQQVSREEEFDGLDDACRHYLALVDGKGVGTARTRVLVSGETKIERVAVLSQSRGRSVGRALMEKAIADIGAAPMTLNAQCHTRGFYEKLGFSAVGKVFVEADIDHVKMVRGPDTIRQRV